MSEITARPTPGNRYKVVPGNRLDNIEKAAYGYVTSLLEGANPFLSSRALSLENRPTIYSGDILTIPPLAAQEKLKTAAAERQLSGKAPDDLTIIIEGREIAYDSARVLRTMDTAADSCTFRIAWEPEADRELDRLLLPYSYPKAQVYIGGKLLINGLVYGIKPEVTAQGKTVDVEIFSFAADVIDSTMPEPYAANNITLQDRANQLLQHIGIAAEFEADDGGEFDRVTGEITDTIFTHLVSLASQRGLLISSTPEGNLLFLKTTTSAPVGTIKTGAPLQISWGANFDGRLLYNQITAIGESPGANTKSATVRDDNVPRSRFLTFKADDTTEGNIEASANWRRSKQFADALTIPFPVSGWYAPNGTLWRENTKVTIVSPEIFVPEDFTFLIRQVEYIIENSGRTATLSIVPPEVYTGERIVLPWEVTS